VAPVWLCRVHCCCSNTVHALISAGPVHNMGLLTILKKIKQKEKEVRLLILYVIRHLGKAGPTPTAFRDYVALTRRFPYPSSAVD
jgi:hypothetical protein